MPTLLSLRHPLADPKEQLAILEGTRVPAFDDVLAGRAIAPLRTGTIEVLQVNVGKLCNQTCAHCHVDAGPDRRESMTPATAGKVIAVLERFPIPTLDITGGAPELSPVFRFLVEEATRLGRRVIDRCNLTVVTLPSQLDLIPFLASRSVEVTASLPSFRASGTDSQRGEGVFGKSIEALRRLNEAGYGQGRGLILNLIHNPVGAFLPGGQASIERDYRREFASRYGIVFDRLFTITNMPISRYLEFLERSGNTARYLELLVRSFNPAAAQGVMCRTHLSVGWDGRLFDCDFNQMLELQARSPAARTVDDLLTGGSLARTVRTDRHCFGCTAGAGSSCGGAVD